VIRVLLLLSLALPAWAQNQYVLVVPASSKISGVTELILEANAKPGELSYPAGDAAGELFARMTKTKLTQVPGAALDDLLRGKISFMFAPVAESAPHVNSGKLRAFAVTGGRAAALPKVPTMAEAGFRGFDEELARRSAK
jgi:tripartite-type tricarboxylate transporter receptor subunit TctC